MHFLQAIDSDLSVLIVCNKTGGTIKGDIKKMFLRFCSGSTIACFHYFVRENSGFKICLQFAVSVICQYVTVNYRDC